MTSHACASALRWSRVAFTGHLATVTRREAFALVKNVGGEPVKHVTKLINYLVIGANGWPLLPDGTVTKKLERAEQLNRKGFGIHIIAERKFLDIGGQVERQFELRKTHPPEDVCAMLNVTDKALRRWEQLGLVEAVDGRYDFQDLVSLQTILRLVTDGVRLDTISRSIQGLSRVLPGTDRPLSQLNIVDANRQTLIAQHGDTLINADGQLLLDFSPPRVPPHPMPLPHSQNDDASQWFEYGQECEEDERYDQAAHAYERALSSSPPFADALFNLGNVRRCLGQVEQAMAAFQAAVAADPVMAAAWYNLADVQEEQGEIDLAIKSLHEAVQIAPTYGDAHFNLALCLERAGQLSEASRHWAQYLELDSHSPWSDTARERLLSIPELRGKNGDEKDQAEF